MSIPTETPQIAATPPGFDPVAFWYLHKGKILALAALFLVGLAAYSIQQYVEHREQAQSAHAFSRAKTADDFKKVIAQHGGTVAAGNAQLRLAELQRNEGKLDEATATLKAFAAQQAKHPLLPGAWLAIASNQEAQGKVEDALATYQKVATTYSVSYAAPLALLGQARLQKQKGQPDLAQRTYEQIATQFENSDFAQQALHEGRSLQKTAP